MKPRRKFCLYCGDHYDSDLPPIHDCGIKNKMFTGHPKDCSECEMPTVKQVIGPIKIELEKEVKACIKAWDTLGDLKQVFGTFEAYLVDTILLKLNKLRGIEKEMTLIQIQSSLTLLHQFIDEFERFCLGSGVNGTRGFHEKLRSLCIEALEFSDTLQIREGEERLKKIEDLRAYKLPSEPPTTVS